MKRILLLFLVPVIILKSGCTDKINPEFNALNLRCEYMNEAVVEKTSPRFSWELVSTQNHQFQTAWQLIVSDKVVDIEENKGSVWDSKKRNGSESFGIKWKENKLKSFTQYYWKVRVWDGDGNISDWSETASFMTGAFNESDWKASWIGDEPEAPLDYPLLYKHIGYLSSYSEKNTEEKWVQIDLSNSVGFNEIKLYPSLNNIRGINDYYFPLSFRIEVSRDGINWETCYENEVVKSPEGKPVSIELDIFVARYVRLVVEKMRSYKHRIHDYEDHGDPSKLYAFSLAEMQILDDEKILSSDCKVSYKDALIKIDREDGYDPDMLTDGITTTPPYPATRPIPPSPMLRKSFELKDKPVKALVCVSALGLYDLSINSQSPDSRVLAPEWTDYNKRVQYQVLDVKNLLEAGTNIIGVQLADGWYAGMLGPVRWSPYYPKRGAYGLDRRFFFQLELEYPDGEKETIVSDESWKIYPDGPIRMADNFLGESYDANKEIKGWKEKDFNDSNWQNVFVDSDADVHLVAQTNQPIKILEILESQSISKTKKGDWLFDIGENIAGWCSIKLDGSAGDKFVLRHGEIIDDEGELYTDNLGAAIQTDTVILGPSGKLEYEPRFTYHGFRYVEVQGLQGTPDKNILKAKVVASEQPKTGYFSCSNEMLNQLFKNLNRSHISNMHGVPTDCPQRDERCGWMGDVYIFAQTAMFNRDMAAFFNKWMQDILDAQSERGTFPDIAPHPFGYEKHFTNAPGWADAGIRLPFLMYKNYGDMEVIQYNFEAYERYIENIRKSNPDLIWRSGLGLNYGDWLNGNTLNVEGFPKTGAQIPSEVFSTIMFYNSVNILSKMAEAIGRKEKADYYSELAANIKEAFLNQFVHENGIIEGDAQACYAMALHYEIYSPELEDKFEKRLIEKFIPYKGRMNTGFHSTLCLMKELAERGYWDKAFDLLETTEFPSWGYSIEQGATSIWERWDGYVKGRGFQGAGMNSFNHYAFGSIGEWMYENILGLNPDEESPGYKHFILKPLPYGSLTWAKGSYHSICGKIEVSWQKDENKFSYQFNIPANTSATVCIPSKNADQVWIDGENLSLSIVDNKISYKDGFTIFELPSGNYTIESEL